MQTNVNFMSENIEYDSVVRLKEWITFNGMSAGGFSKSIGKDPSYVATMKKSPSLDAIKTIMSIYPDFPRDYVLFGEGSLLGKCDDAKDKIIKELESQLDLTKQKLDVIDKMYNDQKKEIENLRHQNNRKDFTISKLKIASKAFLDSLCGDNPSLEAIGEK